MNKNQFAPTDADPIGSFVRTLPKEAKKPSVQNAIRAMERNLYLCYYFDGQRINVSYSWEGGAL